MKFIYRKPKAVSFFFFFITFSCFCLFAETNSAKAKIKMREIYESGTIKFKPVMEVSLETLPEGVPAKTLISLVQGKDRIYITDGIISDIKVLSLDGKFITTYGRRGQGPGDLLLPFRLCFSKERLAVWESRNRRFSYFSLKGKFLKSVKPKLKGRLTGMRSLDDGRIILELEQVEASAKKKEINDWRVLELFSSEMKHIKTIYRQKEHLYKYINEPDYPRLRLPFASTLCWDVLPGGKIVVGFGEKYELKIISLDDDREKVVTRDYVPVRVTKADKNQVLNERAGGSTPRKKISKFFRNNVEFPGLKPAFRQINTDQEGNILVFIYTPLDEGKEPYLVKSFDVFDAAGNYIKRVNVGGKHPLDISRLTFVTNNELWCLTLVDKWKHEFMFVKYKAG